MSDLSASTYGRLKAADPAAATALVEILGIAAGWDAGIISQFCRRAGCDYAEFATITGAYRLAIDQGRRTHHGELF